MAKIQKLSCLEMVSWVIWLNVIASQLLHWEINGHNVGFEHLHCFWLIICLILQIVLRIRFEIQIVGEVLDMACLSCDFNCHVNMFFFFL